MATQQNTVTTSAPTTFVSRAAAKLRQISYRNRTATGITDEEFEKLDEEEHYAVSGIAQGYAVTPREVLEKLRILCGRIRLNLEVKYTGEVLDYLLAEGARSDLEAWILRAEDADADQQFFDAIERLEAIRRDLDNARGPELERLAELARETEQGIVERMTYTPGGLLWKARRLAQLLDGHEGATEFMRLLAGAIVDGLEHLDGERRAAQ